MLKRVAGARIPFASYRTRNASTFQRQPFRLNRVQAAVGVSAISVLAIGLSGVIIDTATHMWLERHLWRLKAKVDSETQEWGWELEAERWTGDLDGGTDRGLGRQGKKAVRDAWFSHHSPEKYGPLDDEEAARNGATNVVDAMLLRTELCLRNAIAIAEQPEVVGRLHPSTLPDLLTRRAAILERLGPSQLIESRAQYDRVFRMLGGKGLQAARIAVKLGDVSQRLGEGPDALVWWARAIQLATDNETGTHNVPEIPSTPPASPAAQRILFAALVSTSAAYAMARQVGQAQKIEEGALDLLRSIRTPDSLESASPPQALHSLSLLHRSAILSLHLAEVLYAQRAPVAECVTRLQAAATSSERVAYALVGTSVRDSDQLAPSVEEPLLHKYTKNPYLEKPAADLLRDSRRSAADIWNLLGEVTERMGPSHRELALDYYTRAVGWAGKTNDEGVMERTDSTLEDDWMLIWRNYHRTRQAVDAESKSK
ncbi:hypothetical protein K438DRAFT_1806222 [Mycena galopus ATCC 62051]|nr:hypothetical protein K438DRAFT_1806222 [Mycena galopus ATCC 62051]